MTINKKSCSFVYAEISISVSTLHSSVSLVMREAWKTYEMHLPEDHHKQITLAHVGRNKLCCGSSNISVCYYVEVTYVSIQILNSLVITLKHYNLQAVQGSVPFHPRRKSSGRCATLRCLFWGKEYDELVNTEGTYRKNLTHDSLYTWEKDKDFDKHFNKKDINTFIFAVGLIVPLRLAREFPSTVRHSELPVVNVRHLTVLVLVL